MKNVSSFTHPTADGIDFNSIFFTF